MTDARVSRAHVEALAVPAPTQQVTREHVEALINTLTPEQVSRLHVEVLVLVPVMTGRWTMA